MTQPVQAKEFLDPEGVIVKSATLLADELIARMKMGELVEVAFSEMNGIPTSYFNLLLLRIVAAFGKASLHSMVEFKFESKSQQQVFERSLAAVEKSVN